MRASTLTINRVDAAGWEETAGVLETLHEQDTGAGYGAILSGLADGAGAALGGSYGGIVQGAGRVLGGLLDGKGQSGAAAGKSLGGLAGSALGTALGGPLGGALAGAAGDVLGGVIGGAIDSARKKPPNKKARQAARAKAQAKVQARLAKLEASQGAPPKPTTIAPPARPAVPSKRDTAPASVAPATAAPAAATQPPPAASPAALPPTAPPPPATPPDYPPELRNFRETLSMENALRLDQAVRERRGLEVLREILAERRAIETMAAEVDQEKRERERLAAEHAAQLAREQAERERIEREAAAPVEAAQLARERIERETAAPAEAAPLARVPGASPPPAPAPQPAKEPQATAQPAPASPAPAPDTAGDYDDTAAPPAKRPQPRRHLGLIPLKQHQLEALLLGVPALRSLDPRLLRLLSGRGSTVRDTAGIDPGARAYIPLAGETAAGIAKKLTGREERAADLLAANPARREGEPWRIPPGWMYFVATDTGEPGERSTDTAGTSRVYIVQAGDTPVGVAQKSGAKGRARWWAELKAANPQIPTKDNGQNFERFFAGQQLWIPEEWPASPLFQPAGGALPPLNVPQTPGFPGLPAIPGLPVPGPSMPGTTPPNTTVDPGVPLQAQAMLALWARTNPAAVTPADYGSTAADFTSTTSSRFTSALASFQQWHNARNPASPLRTDGVMDEPTYKALHASVLAGVPVPGPGAVPYPKPEPQPPPAGPVSTPSAPLLWALLVASGQGVPGIHGGMPQLGGLSFPGAANVPIRALRSNAAPLPPGAVPGFHVAGQPSNVVWDYDGTMVSLPPGLQPLDGIYGTPPSNFVWQGGTSVPGPQNLPWVQAANPLPVTPTPVTPTPGQPWPWPWSPVGPGAPSPTQPAAQPAPQAQTQPAPARDDGALPIAGLLAALAFLA